MKISIHKRYLALLGHIFSLQSGAKDTRYVACFFFVVVSSIGINSSHIIENKCINKTGQWSQGPNKQSVLI